MTSKEKKEDDTAEAFSWWSHGSQYNNHPLHQSHWLQTNLSEVDEKIKAMVSIIEEDGDSFAKRAEMYYKKRPQLLKAVDDLHKSYRCLALKYDQLRSHFTRLNHIPMSSSLSALKSLRSQLLENESSLIDGTFLVLSTTGEAKQKVVETPQTVFEREMVEKSSFSTSSNGAIDEVDECFGECSMDREWANQKVSEMIEDHVRHQAELVKRNEAKREKINELRSEVKKLMHENKALKTATNTSGCVKPNNGTPKNNNDTKPKGTLCLFGKLTGCSC